jgi:hypothetical protein
MEFAILLMILLVVVAIAALKMNEGGVAFPFHQNKGLFSNVECTFIRLIEVAVGKEYRVMCRIRLSDILSLHRNTDRKTARTALSRANNKYLDFVLCDRESMKPVIAIDLVHDKGNEGYKLQRDWFVGGALDAARIPHLRIKVKSGYKPEEIRACIQAKLASVQTQMSPQPLVKGTNDKDPNKPPTRPIRSNRPIAA